MRIALVDDDHNFVMHVAETIQKGTGIVPDVYESPHLPEAYDILVLDIEMPGQTGIELAEDVLKSHPDTSIIFFTSHQDYVFSSFKVHPYDYILKDHPETLLPSVKSLLAAKSKSVLIVTHRGLTTSVNIADISYIESFGHKTYFHMAEGDVVPSGDTLADIEKTLDDRFYRLNRSTVIQWSHVRTIRDGQVIMDDTALSVRRGEIKDVTTLWKAHAGDVL